MSRMDELQRFGSISAESLSSLWCSDLGEEGQAPEEERRQKQFEAAQFQLARAKHDLEYLLMDSGLIQTWDPADKEHPMKCLPLKDHLRLMIRWWQQHEKTAFPKSRDVMCTLTLTGCHVGTAMLWGGTEYIFLSDKAEKAEKNVERAWTNYQSLPPEILRMIPARRWLGKTGDTRKIQFISRPPLFPGDVPFVPSTIVALGQGAQQIETFHPSGIFFDQVESVPDLKGHLASILPIAKPGIRLTLCGTVQPGYWEKICHDKLELDAIDASRSGEVRTFR